jgi:succinoglycan biosynthesis transport protein ExoP
VKPLSGDESKSNLILPADGGASALAPAGFNGVVLQVPAKTEGNAWEGALRVLQKNWKLGGVFAGVVFVAVTIVALSMKSTYSPTARVEVDPPEAQVFSMKDIMNSGGGVNDHEEYLQTQLQILQSDELALDVVRTLRLDSLPEFVGKRALEDAANSPTQAAGTEMTKLESIALESVHKRLSATVIPDSRLIEVSFTSHDPWLAANVLNGLLGIFIDNNYRNRYEVTMQASEWLSSQLTDLRQKVEKANQALVDYQKQNGFLTYQQTNAFQPNPLIQKLLNIINELAAAQADRITYQAALEMLKSGREDNLVQVRNDVTLQGLKTMLFEARGKLAQATAFYGKNNPNVKQLENQVKDLEGQQKAELQKILASVQVQYQAAQAREAMTEHEMNNMKGAIDNMNEKMIQYDVLKQEAQTSSDLYNNLLAQLKEAGISAGLKSSNIRIVDRAQVLFKPTGPHRLLDITLGLLLGIVGGVFICFGKERMENTIRTPEDIKQLTGLPSLAVFPLNASRNGNYLEAQGAEGSTGALALTEGDGAKGHRRWIFLEQPNSAEAEAVRSLRTALMLSRPGKPPQVLLVVSPLAKEGKTTVALNLAAVLAQNARTCLLDCDLRRPQIGRSFGLASRVGLSTYLTGSTSLDEVLVSIPDIPNLFALPVGPLPPTPGELVTAEPMRQLIQELRRRFDFLVIDSPPVMPFADARQMSSLADGVILVARCGMTTRQAILRSTELLFELRAPVLGVVLNGVDIAAPDYHYYQFGYTGYRYGYGYKHGYYDHYGDGKAKGRGKGSRKGKPRQEEEESFEEA